MMMGLWHHPDEEEPTIGAVLKYKDKNLDAKWRLRFGDGEEYICTYFTAYESENAGDLDITEDDPRYDEFYEVGFLVVEVIHGGRREPGPRAYLAINYRDFPELITDATTGEVIYPAQGSR